MIGGIEYYLVDVFTEEKYQGNQLAVFIDFKNQIDDEQMLTFAKEINFAESVFIKEIINEKRFKIRIFTPEYEVPFAGHPCLGAAYVISKFIVDHPIRNIELQLSEGTIDISIDDPERINRSLIHMRQHQPVFKNIYSKKSLAKGLGFPEEYIHDTLPVQEISTGLPYIIVPVSSLNIMEKINLKKDLFYNFLVNRGLHKSNSPDKLSTALFLFTEETYNSDCEYNTRMFALENDNIVEDAATGSANGCFLAYLLKYKDDHIQATVEQGYQMGRKSKLYLNGKVSDDSFDIIIGGHVVQVSKGIWNV